MPGSSPIADRPAVLNAVAGASASRPAGNHLATPPPHGAARHASPTPHRGACRRRRRERGSTLLEAVTAIGVGSIVVFLAGRLFVGMLRHGEVQRARLEMAAQARTLRHAFLADVRRSAGVAASAGPRRGSVVALRLPAGAEAEYVVYRAGKQGVTRTLLGRRGGGALPTTQTLAPDLDGLRIRTTPVGGSTLVEASVRAEKRVRRRPVSVSLSFAAATRGGTP